MENAEKHHILVAIAALLAVGGMIISARRSHGKTEDVKKGILGVWVVSIPVWFWFEYTFLLDDTIKNDPHHFERLKYSQELASKVWLAVTAVLSLLYFNVKPVTAGAELLELETEEKANHPAVPPDLPGRVE